MSGLERIIEHIRQEAGEEAAQITSAAREEAQKLLSLGKEEADKQAAAIAKQSDLDVAATVSRIASVSELREKRVVLQAKQKAIEDVFEGALKSLNTMDDAAYFQVIRQMLSHYATGERGEIQFSARDLSRLPADVKEAAVSHGLTVSDQTAQISGGFILVYGDIDENCSFEALIDASRETLLDEVSRMLFG